MQLVIREVWVHPLNTTGTGKGEFCTLYPDLHHYPKLFMDWIGTNLITYFKELHQDY